MSTADGTMDSQPLLNKSAAGELLTLTASGSWTAVHAETLERQVQSVTPDVLASRRTAIDLSAVRELDTLGAWLLERLLRRCAEQGHDASFIGLPNDYRGVIEEMHQVNRRPAPHRRKPTSCGCRSRPSAARRCPSGPASTSS